jgi:hypothetical protein
VKYPWDFRSNREEIEWLQAEVERLRAALERIDTDPEWQTCGDSCVEFARPLVRAALAEEVTPIHTDP